MLSERGEDRKGMTELKAYIWDLDGTLFDSYDSIVSSLVDHAQEYRIPDSYDDIMKAVKQGSVSGYLRSVADRLAGSAKEPALFPADCDFLYRRYREISHERLDRITLIPGATETLSALQAAGAKHFVYTHRGKSTDGLLKRLGLQRFFVEIVTSENGFQPKPSGEGVTYLVEKYGLDRDNTAYVGDRTPDVQCAKDAGVKAILYLPEDSCVVPTEDEDLVIRNLAELVER